MITLNEYKTYLINYYVHEIDNNDDKRLYRKESLEKQYNDEDLTKIINDTYDFIKEALCCDTINSGYSIVPLEDDTTSYISLNLVGGWFADTLFTDLKGKIISRYIMKYVLGSHFDIEVIDEEIERDNEDDDIVSFYHNYYMYLRGFPKNIEEIKENIFGNSKLLTK